MWRSFASKRRLVWDNHFLNLTVATFTFYSPCHRRTVEPGSVLSSIICHFAAQWYRLAALHVSGTLNRLHVGAQPRLITPRQVCPVVPLSVCAALLCWDYFSRCNYDFWRWTDIGFERRWVAIFGRGFVVPLHSRIIGFYGMSWSPAQLKSWPCPWVKPWAAGTSRQRRGWAAGCPSWAFLWRSASRGRPTPKIP